MESVQLSGIVLSRYDSGESDRVVTILSREEGKVQIVMKGARKPTSRLAAASEPMNLVRFNAATGKARRFAQQTQIESTYGKVRRDYARLLIGLCICEAFDILTPAHMQDEALYELLVQTLNGLADSEKPWILFLWAVLQLFENQGNQPHFSTCFVCEKPVSSKAAWFAPHAGGITCHDHVKDAPKGRTCNGYVLAGLSALAQRNQPPPHMKLIGSSLEIILWCLREASDQDCRSLTYAIAELEPTD